MQADYRRPTQVLEHKGLWRRSRCFYCASSSFSEEALWQSFGRNVAQMCHRIFYVSRHFDSLNGRKFHGKTQIRTEVCYPSAQRFPRGSKEGVEGPGLPIRTSIPLAACEHEMRRGDNTEAVTQFEARVAATLTNLAKQGQSLHTLAQAQVALTDVLLKYVITCVVEPPDDALPAARVRARLRYEKLVRAAAKEISNKNRDTLREMLADE